MGKQLCHGLGEALEDPVSPARRNQLGNAVALGHARRMPTLVTITGPIAAGKNTVASLLAQRWSDEGATVVLADVDAVAAMVAGPGAAEAGLWFAAHEVHGALVARWMLTEVDVVISVGPVYTEAEQAALFGQLPPDARPWRVLIDAPLSATWERASADERRGISRQRDFHVAAHARFRALLPGIPHDLLFNSGDTSAADIAAAVIRAVGAFR
jgi:adenylylsulfate kinase-like enzyme